MPNDPDPSIIYALGNRGNFQPEKILDRWDSNQRLLAWSAEELASPNVTPNGLLSSCNHRASFHLRTILNVFSCFSFVNIIIYLT